MFPVTRTYRDSLNHRANMEDSWNMWKVRRSGKFGILTPVRNTQWENG